MFHFAVETLQALEVPLGDVPEPDAPPPVGPVAPVSAVPPPHLEDGVERGRLTAEGFSKIRFPKSKAGDAAIRNYFGTSLGLYDF